MLSFFNVFPHKNRFLGYSSISKSATVNCCLDNLRANISSAFINLTILKSRFRINSSH